MEIRIGKWRTECPNAFWTSDWHLGHENIIRYSKRPFRDVQEMDNTIITRCNERVGPDDIMFYLGDFCFYDRRRDRCRYEELAEHYRNRINCKNIYYVHGNHDKKLRGLDAFRRLWRGTYDLLDVEVDGQKIILCHYAMRVWDRSHHGSYSLYGHSHGDLPDDPKLLSFDCGVDCFNYYPVSFSEVNEIMAKKRQAGAGNTLHHKRSTEISS